MNRGGSRQDYPTPWKFIRACERRFGRIFVDLAASEENKKALFCFTKDDDSLSIRWGNFQRSPRQYMWLNPPFSDITPWARKCAEEGFLGARILFLTPASIGSNWFRDHVHRKALVLALNGRITFEGASDPYPKDCILSVFGTGATGFDVWDWQKEANPMDDPML